MKERVLATFILFTFVITGLSGFTSATNGTVWYQSENHTYDMYINSTVGYSSSDSSLEDNWIALSAHVYAVTKVGTGWEYVFVNISAAAYSKATEIDTTYYDDWGIPSEMSTTIKCPDKIKIFATQNNVPNNLKINFEYTDNAGVNVTGDKYHGSKVDKFMRDASEFAMDQIIGSVPYLGLAYSTAKFLYNELSPTGVENMYGTTGSGTAWESFYFENNKIDWTDTHSFWLGQEYQTISNGHAVYSASSSIQWEIPISEMNTYTLTIGAQNIMGMWVDGIQTGTKNGAYATITITIKNGKISAFNAYTQNVNGQTTTTLYTKNYTPSWVSDPDDYYAAPTLIVEATTLNNVPLNYKVEWGDGAYSYAYGHTSGEQYSFSHKYYPGGIGATKYYTIKVTAYTDDYYGGWSETRTIKIKVINNGKMSGGGGGGACPFLYSFNPQNQTWRNENNVLVWAENATRKRLETKDSYLIGNITSENGTIKLGIGEYGDDVDFIDAVKVYRVNVPEGYEVAEDYWGRVYAYTNVSLPLYAKDNQGRNVMEEIKESDGHYWVGEKGSYIDVKFNLSKRNLLLIRGIDNPPTNASTNFRPPATLSTIWVYENISGEWVKLKEIKVRHNLHTNAINLNGLIHRKRGTVELRFEMRDRNGIDFIGVTHNFRKAGLKRVRMLSSSLGYNELKRKDGKYLRINPGDFVRMEFKDKGNGTYLVKVYGFYFNKEKIGKGIGIVRENETNIAEAELQRNITSNKEYVLLPLLNNYSGISEIMWFVDGYYLPSEKPVVEFSSGEHFVELRILRYNGTIGQYVLYITAS